MSGPNAKATKPGRPAAFDAAVMRFRPGLINLSARYIRDRDARYDLVTDTIATALHRWGSFREDGGMWNWLALTMRSLARDQRRAAARKLITVSDPDGRRTAMLATQPAQEEYAELCHVLRGLSGRHRDVLLRRSMGEELDTIAADYGVSKRSVQQMVSAVRARLRDREATTCA